MLDFRQDIKAMIEECYCEIIAYILPKLDVEWQIELNIHVNNNYSKFKANYETLYKYYQRHDPMAVDIFSLDGTAMGTLLLYFPAFKKIITESMPKQLSHYIWILHDGRNRVEHYKVSVIDEINKRDFYFDQFNALACIIALTVLMKKEFPHAEKWEKVLQKAYVYQNKFIGERWLHLLSRTEVVLDDDEDFSEILLNAESGDVLSQVKAGKAYFFGDRIEIDYGKAFYWFRRAGYYGKNSEAKYYIGKCYIKGFAVDYNHDLGMKYIKEASDSGVPEAQYEIAFEKLFSGSKLEADKKQIFMLTQASADQNYLPAISQLGLLYRAGIGVKKDEKCADQLTLKAALLGSTSSCMYFADRAKEKNDIQEEMKWLKEAMKNGDESARSRLLRLQRESQKETEQ